jgi:hypothetical protein
MRSAGNARLARRLARRAAPWVARRLAPWVAVAGLAGGLLAGCSGSGPSGGHGASPPAAGRARGPGGRFVAVPVIGVVGGGGGVVFVGGPGGGIVGGPGLGTSGSRPKITVGPIPPASSGQVVNLPLNTYANVAEAQQTTLSEASTLLTQQCMATRGFVYATQATASQVQILYQTAESGYGVSSLTDAGTYGYGQPKSNSQNEGPAFLGGFASFRDLAKQPRAWVEALLGFAPGARIARIRQPGCLQQAGRELYSGGSLSDPVPQIALQASQWTQSDPRVLAVDAAWSRCLSLAGYHYASPQQAADKRWPSKPTPAETATATADVRCKQQVNLVNTWLTVEAAYQAALISQNLATLTALQTTFTKLLARAELLLSLGSSTSLGSR